MKSGLLYGAWATLAAMAQTAATVDAVARPDLVGALHYAAFAVGAGGMMAAAFHTDDDPSGVRHLVTRTGLATVTGSVAGSGWSEWTGHANIALVFAVGAACLTVWGLMGRDMFSPIDRLLKLWRGRKG